MKPTFVGIGAQKCASSWLYDILADHPEVCVSEKKELNFFTDHYDNGYKWYESNFVPKAGSLAVGEISPSYFHEASVPERVKRYNPDARILVSLRDPVDRALSQHRHLVRLGVVQGPDYSFETALASNPSYIEQGLYGTHLSRWLECFPMNQVHVVLMEDIRANCQAVAQQVYAFLGVSQSHLSANLNEKSNPSYALRFRAADVLVKNVRGSIKRLGAESIWRAFGNTGLRQLYRTVNRIPSHAVIPKPVDETLSRLRAQFEDEVKLLEKLLGRPLTAWLPR